MSVPTKPDYSIFTLIFFKSSSIYISKYFSFSIYLHSFKNTRNISKEEISDNVIANGIKISQKMESIG